MKRLTAISLLLLYSAANLGVTILLHTCGGESEAIIAATSAEDPCGCAEMMPSDRCCSTELTTVMIDDEHTLSAFAEQPLTSVHLPRFPAMSSGPVDRHIGSGIEIPYSPPPNDDLQLLHSVFRI